MPTRSAGMAHALFQGVIFDFLFYAMLNFSVLCIMLIPIIQQT